MKVGTPTGMRHRCDSCGRLEDIDRLTKDRRPRAGSRDRFFSFVIPPSRLDPITKKPAKGYFRGLASASDPNKLAALDCCPACQPKVKEAFKRKNPELLPDGPLKPIMREIHLRYNLKSVRIN